MEILKHNPFINDQDDLTKLLVTILDDVPNSMNASDLEAHDYGNDQLKVLGSAVYIHCREGAGKTKITNTVLEKKTESLRHHPKLEVDAETQRISCQFSS